MLKRLWWMSIGAAAGVGGSWWVTRRIREAANRYLPAQLQDRATTAVRGLGGDLKAAVAEGREAMREREQGLRSEFDRTR